MNILNDILRNENAKSNAPGSGTGTPGADGRTPEFQVGTTHIQWRYAGETAWNNLVPLADLKGNDGKNIELQTTATAIQWRTTGGSWADLVLLSAIKGSDAAVNATNVSATISGVEETTTIADSDIFSIFSTALKKITWTNFKKLLFGGITGGLTIIGAVATTGRLFLRGNAEDLTTGGVTVKDTTDSTSTTTGALIVEGGAAVTKNLSIGGKILLGAATVLGYKIDIYTATDADNGLSLRNASTGTSSACRIVITDQTGATQGVYTVPATTNTNSSILGVARALGVFFYSAARHLVVGTLGAFDVVIGTAGVERIRISGTSGDTTIAGNISAKQGTVTVQALTYAATITPDFNLGQMATLTLTGNATLANPTNVKAGSSMQIKITQDSTGSRTLGYGTNFKWAGGIAPTLSTAANAVDILSLYSYDGTTIYGALLRAFA